MATLEEKRPLGLDSGREESDGRGGQGQVPYSPGAGRGLGFCSPHNEKLLQGLHLSLGSHFSCEKIVLDAGERAEKGQEHKEAAESSSRASSPQVTSSLNCEPGVFTRRHCTAVRVVHCPTPGCPPLNLHMDSIPIASVLCDFERLLPA